MSAHDHDGLHPAGSCTDKHLLLTLLPVLFRVLCAGCRAGTFALLGRTAELVMQYPAKQVQQQIGRYTDLIGAWFRAHELAGTLSFNSSNSSSKTNLWAEAPAMAQALPAVAHLMHAYFQQPPKARLCVSYDLYYFGALLQQLLLLVDGAVTKPGQGPCTGSSSSSSTGRSRVASSSATATQQLEEQQAPASQEPQPPLPPQPACILVDETVFPQSSRARVRGPVLLWCFSRRHAFRWLHQTGCADSGCE